MRFRWSTLGLIFSLGACSSEDSEPVQHIFTTRNPIAAPEKSLLDGTGQEACETYKVETCDDGRRRVCSVFDADQGEFITPDPLTQRAFMYERYNDLYHTPDGIAAKRSLNQETMPDVPEEVWGGMGHFAEYNGMGDSAMWNATSLSGYVLRYATTGTEIDYQRMEKKVRDHLTLFETTNVPGYLARFHYLMLPDGAPQTDEHAIFYESMATNHTFHETESSALLHLPAVYSLGVRDPEGILWHGTPMWQGTPTIDQYSGSTTALPAAWGLLKDQELKDRIAYHLGCYLKRLERFELTHIQSNPEAKEAMAAILQNDQVSLEDDDIDLSKLDRLVMYYLPQINDMNRETFDKSCPDSIALEPTRVIDARAPTFREDLLNMMLDLDGKFTHRAKGIDHYYIPTARGYDAVHLMHLAALMFHFTGDEMYRSFLEDELVGNLQADKVAQTWSALVPNKWCRKWYSAHIAIPPLWSFINILEDSDLRNQMLSVLWEEAWLKDAAELGMAKFAFMLAGVLPGEMVPDHGALKDEGVMWLSQLHGFGDYPDSPRRTYSLDYQYVVDNMPADIEAECPTEEIRQQCEEGPNFLGIQLEGWDITKPCTGAPDECKMSNGECARKQATKALPVDLREWWGYQWQGDPFRLGISYPMEGERQSIGVDMFEVYWLARYYGFLDEGKSTVLAWKDEGTCQ